VIDLHTHSTASDGEWRPRQVIEEALRRKLSAIALTDHDTVGGLVEARQTAQGSDLRVIPGVELSSDYGGTSLHVLGYFVNDECPQFEERLALARQARDTRNPRIVEKLQALGVAISMEQVEELADGVVGRPHIAQAIVNAGGATNIRAAFDQFLGEKGKAYVAKRRIPPRAAFQWIHDAGGVAVVAHPRTLRYKMPKLKYGDCIGLWALDGLDGVEVHYSGHDPGTVKELLGVAKRMNLAITGGSDFHGPNVRKGVSIGVGYGSMNLPDSLLDGLVEAWRKRHGHSASEVPTCMQ
jgi:predicted metal-dependent phosphoesterase TrpH